MTRTYRQLSAEDRGTVMGMKLHHCSIRAIARVLGRSPSTVSRELRRNDWQSEAAQCVMGRPRIAGGYDAHRAGKRARRVRRAAWPARKLDLMAWELNIRPRKTLGWKSPALIRKRCQRHEKSRDKRGF